MLALCLLDVIKQGNLIECELSIFKTGIYRKQIIHAVFGTTRVKAIAHGRIRGRWLPLKNIYNCLHGGSLIGLMFEFKFHCSPPQIHFTSVAGDESLKICSTLILTALFL